jgi:hypothetical protein
MATGGHSGLPYRYIDCRCEHCSRKEVVTFDQYTEIQNEVARQAEEDMFQTKRSAAVRQAREDFVQSEHIGGDVWAKRQEHIDSIVDPEARAAQQRERDKLVAEAERRSQRIAELREALSSRTLSVPDMELDREEGGRYRKDRKERSVSSAFEVQNSSGEVLISLSSEDLALLVRHLLFQARQWKNSQSFSHPAFDRETVVEPCACGEPGCSARVVRDGKEDKDNG